MQSQGARVEHFIDGEADINLREFSFQDSAKLLGARNKINRLRFNHLLPITLAQLWLMSAEQPPIGPNWLLIGRLLHISTKRPCGGLAKGCITNRQ